MFRRSICFCAVVLRAVSLFFFALKSCTIYYSTTNKQVQKKPHMRHLLVEGGGFEPPKSATADLQSAPFGHSGTLPKK